MSHMNNTFKKFDAPCWKLYWKISRPTSTISFPIDRIYTVKSLHSCSLCITPTHIINLYCILVPTAKKCDNFRAYVSKFKSSITIALHKPKYRFSVDTVLNSRFRVIEHCKIITIGENWSDWSHHGVPLSDMQLIMI